MIIEKKTMNILFYLGIIVPTIITVILFVLFIVCWYRFKARRQVLNKKHDPHGKLRQMGVNRAPPPPPPMFVHQQFHRINLNGMDNDAYTVSRSPSTEQDQGARPGLYHVPHDSGLSELSELQCKDRPHSQASQGSTDSEDSGFRSSRSGQFHPNNTNNQLQDAPLLRGMKTSKSNVETVQLSPCETAEWPQGRSCAQTLNSSARNLNKHARSSERNLNCAVKTINSSSRNLNSSSRNLNSSSRNLNSSSRNLNSTPRNLNSSSRNFNSCRGLPSSSSFNDSQGASNMRKVDLTDISTHISWMYLQNLAASSGQTCCTDPAVTTAQIHSVNPGVDSVVESGGDLLGYSVV